MRSLIARHIVQRLSSKRVRQIEIRITYTYCTGGDDWHVLDWWHQRPKILHTLSEQAQGSQNGPSFPGSILSLVLQVNSRTTLLRWRQERKKKKKKKMLYPLATAGGRRFCGPVLHKVPVLWEVSLMFSVGNLYLVSTINGEVIYQPNAASTFLKTELWLTGCGESLYATLANYFYYSIVARIS